MEQQKLPLNNCSQTTGMQDQLERYSEDQSSFVLSSHSFALVVLNLSPSFLDQDIPHELCD